MEHIAIPALYSKIIKGILYAFLGLSTLFLAFCIWQYIGDKNRLIRQDQENALNITKKAAQIIGKFAQDWKKSVDTLAEQLSVKPFSQEEIIKLLHQKPSPMHGLGVAFLSHAHKGSKLFAPYFVGTEHGSELVHLEKYVDYSAQSYKRFTGALQGKGQWHDPFWDDVNKKLIWEYAAPFYDKDHKVIGVVFGNYTIEYIQSFVASVYPSNYGYGEIYTKKGIFVSHPNYEYVGHKRTPVDIARDAKDFELAEIFTKALKGEVKVDYEKTNWLSGQRSMITFESVPGTDWLTQGVFVLTEFQTTTDALQRKFINVIISLIIFIFLALLLWIQVYNPTTTSLWITSTALSIAMLIIISFIWYGVATKAISEPFTVIQNNFNIGDLLKEYNKNNSIIKKTSFDQVSKDNTIDGYTLIPTGIFLYDIALNLDNIMINGYAWQQIPLKQKHAITPGIILPQARDFTMKKWYENTVDDWHIIGWKIQGTINQNFDFFSYPLDSKQIGIEFWPVNNDEKVILLPDFHGYKVFNATSLPGINTKISLRNWYLNKSYFCYKKEIILSNLGHHSPNSYTFDIGNDPLQRPHLYFNIEARRKAIGALALSLMPIVIILTLLFILLLMAGTIEFQFMFGSIASLFFTSLIAYTAFKTYLSIQNVIFLDYLYFLLQGSILIIAIIDILYHKKFNISFIDYKKLLIPQLLFWPLVLGALLFVSLIFFY